MVGTRRLSELVESATARLELPDDDLVVGLSGGADSTALTFLCREAGRSVRALHVNHGLPSSSLMEKAARSVAERLEVELDVQTVTVPDGPSPEGQARRARYTAFAEGTDSRQSLLTAHTKDDDVETILFNVIRGTGPRGLAGIPYHRPPNIYRPMLSLGRAETREIAALSGLAFMDDPMNDDPGMTRNVMRAEVIPMLTELNPQLADSLTRMAAAVARDAAHLDRLAAQIPLRHGDGSVAVAIGDLLASPKPVADRVLQTMLVYAVGGDGVTAQRVQRLWSVVTGVAPAQSIASEVEARRVGPMLAIQGPADRADNEIVELTPGKHLVGGVEFDVLRFDGPCRVMPLSKWTAVFPPATVLEIAPDGVVSANGEPAWLPGQGRYPVAWYEPGSLGYLSVFAREKTGTR